MAFKTQAKEAYLYQANCIALSLIICSRNDDYMGDPMWRLATSINYLSDKIYKLNRELQVEIVVTDWGSLIPISNVIRLTEQASAITRFVCVPAELATKLQKDSPFGEVYALNAAARRSRGQYIGRIDQDTLVTQEFIALFFDTLGGKNGIDFDMENTYMFAARKQLPYAFVSQKPSLNELDTAIHNFKHLTLSEELPFCHWASAVGILMMHRNMWHDIGGYDERLIYYWFMDVDLATRLSKKYTIVNIGKTFGYHFFHLEHIKAGFKFRHSHRKLNPRWAKSFDKPILNPNGENWGLANIELAEQSASTMQLEMPSHQKNRLDNNTARLTLFIQIVAMSTKCWIVNQLRFLRYLMKRLFRKPYL